MNAGDVVLARMLQPGGRPPKLRPALVLAALQGPYQRWLLAGITTQWHSAFAGWDDLIQPGDPDFAGSGLRLPSMIRLSFLHAAAPTEITGIIGRIDKVRLDRLSQFLSDHLRP